MAKTIMTLLLLGSVWGNPIPSAPTGDDEIPDAIVGKGAPPAGVRLAYFEGHPNTVG
jgi:hypothetical protein